MTDDDGAPRPSTIGVADADHRAAGGRADGDQVALRTFRDDLAALTSRAQGSFLGRCVLRFVRIGGLDRCVVLSSQAFTALIPLLILAGALAPAGDEDDVAQGLIRKFGLSGDSADAVTQLFTAPAAR